MNDSNAMDLVIVLKSIKEQLERIANALEDKNQETVRRAGYRQAVREQAAEIADSIKQTVLNPNPKAPMYDPAKPAPRKYDL